MFVVGLADAAACAGGGGVGAVEDDADELPPPPLDEFVERIRRDDVGCGFRSNACRGIVVQTLLTALLLANLNMVAWILTVDLRRFVEFALWLLFSVACACRFLFSLSFYVNFQTNSQEPSSTLRLVCWSRPSPHVRCILINHQLHFLLHHRLYIRRCFLDGKELWMWVSFLGVVRRPCRYGAPDTLRRSQCCIQISYLQHFPCTHIPLFYSIGSILLCKQGNW